MNNYKGSIDPHRDLNGGINEIKHTLKCVFLGSAGTGKSSIIQRYMTEQFISHTAPTIGAAFNAKIVPTKALGMVKLEIWDTAGQERFDSLIPLYYRGAKIVFVVYDITSQESFNKAKNWVTKIRNETREHPMFILVGNKIDLVDLRAINNTEAKLYADSQEIGFKECSAKTGMGINTLIENAYQTAAEQMSKEHVSINISERARTINLEESRSSTRLGFIPGCFGTVIKPLSTPLYNLYTKITPNGSDKSNPDVSSTSTI